MTATAVRPYPYPMVGASTVRSTTGPAWTRAEYAKLCEHLRERRKALGWSLPTLAEMVGVRPPTLGSWERGDRTPSVPSFITWARVLGYELEIVPTGYTRQFDPDQVQRLVDAATATYTEALAVVDHDQLAA